MPHTTLPSWYRNRKYLHFDRPINLRKATSIVENPTLVASHSFWPFIGYEIESNKITKDKTTGKIENKPKLREIAYASHIDSHIYAYYNENLHERYERRLADLRISESVIAFRSLGKSNIDFAKDAFDKIREMAPCAVLGLDISKFFDNIDHKILKQQWKDLIGEKQLPPDHFNVYKSLTKWSKINRDDVYRLLSISKHNPRSDNRKRLCTPKEFRDIVRKSGLIEKTNKGVGIPQGSPISATLSNIYMLSFDEEMARTTGSCGGHYLRYCDDMLFIVPTSELEGIKELARRKIEELNIELNQDKTEEKIFAIDTNGTPYTENPLQYLGFLYDGQKILLRSAALARFSERMKRGVKLAKKTKEKRDSEKISGNQKASEAIYKRKLYERYSHLGKKNFVRYAIRASNKMKSKEIRRQIKPLWENLQKEIDKE